MPTSEDDVLDLIRSHFAAAIEKRDDATRKLDRAMSHLKDLIENGKKLAAERADLIADRDSERTARGAAEKLAADLQARIEADDAEAKAAKEALDAEIFREAGLGAKALPNVDGQGLQPVTTAAPSGAAVTVFATSTEHTAVDGTVTTLDHTTGSATAVDAASNPVEPVPSAVAEAQAAKDAAGAPIPSA